MATEDFELAVTAVTLLGRVEMYCTRTKNPNCSKQFTVKQPLGGVLKNRCSKICGQNP